MLMVVPCPIADLQVNAAAVAFHNVLLIAKPGPTLPSLVV